MFQQLWAVPKAQLVIGLMTLLLTASIHAKDAVDDLHVAQLSRPDQGGKPAVCVNLNYQINGSHSHIEDYVRLESASVKLATIKTKHNVSMQLRDNQLCLGQLKHGRYYLLTLRDGLPLENDQYLEEDYRYRFYVQDRKPKVSFQTATFVLPTNESPLVPVKVVNFDEIDVQVYRLSPEQVQQRMISERFFESLRGYDFTYWRKHVQLIGETKVQLDTDKNVEKTFNLDLSEVMANQLPGAYFITIPTSQSKWDHWPIQRLIYTDTGLASLQGLDGLHVYARSYQTAEPKQGIELALMGRNHDVLDTATTNAMGKVVFSGPLMQGKHGHEPAQVRYLSDSGDYAVLNLTGPKLDVSDRPVAGAAALQMLNAYLFSERGVYRLGEPIVITGLVRDKHLKAIAHMPLILRVVRPNGDVALTKRITQLTHGGFQERMLVPTSGRTGQWEVELAMASDQPALGSMTFEVADYVPETIKVELSRTDDVYINDPFKINLKSDYLYGAAAEDLVVEGSVAVAQNRRLFGQFKDYVFGSQEDFKTDLSLLEEVKTNQDGRAEVVLPSNLLERKWQQHALQLNVRLKVIEPSGRPATRALTLPALQFPSWVGIKAPANYPVYDRKKPVIFNVTAITDTQERIPDAKLRYQLIKEDWDYHWYYNNNRWQYRVNKFDDEMVTKGNLATNNEGLASIDLGTLNWGRYRLEVINSQSGQTTQLAFRNGWWNADGSQSAMPDNVKLAPSQKSIEVGDAFSVKVEAPYAGKLHLVVANDQVIEEQIVALPQGATEINLIAKETWGQGAYLLASVYRPGQDHVGPARAIGINYVKLNRPELHGQVSIEAPKIVKPNEPVAIKLATDLPKGSQVMLAAVDEGILQLTRYDSPNPAQWFLQKRRLGVSLRDLYGHLIQQKQGEVIRMHFGGDGDTGAPTAPPMDTFVKPVALVSKLVAVDAAGSATIELDFPQFNGQVRLMAVAFDDMAMAASDGSMMVRNPIVVQPTLPRFLALNDTAEMGLSLHNIELPETDVTLQWQVSSGLKLDQSVTKVRLAKDQRKDISIMLTALQPGTNNVTLTVLVEGKTPQVHHWDMTVVFNRFVETRTQQVFAEAGERKVLMSLVGDLEEPSRRLSLVATDQPNVPAKWLADSLSRYPFGCLEQTTSKAWPMLMLDEKRDGINTDKRNQRISQAIGHLATMQLHDGSFSLWRGGRYRQEWLSMYATEFLMEAESRGHPVPSSMLKQAQNYVNNYSGSNQSALAYAYYLQARQNQLDPGDLRYFARKAVRSNYRPQIYVHLIQAADMLGQSQLIKPLVDASDHNGDRHWSRRDYGTEIRDKAMATRAMLSLSYVTSEQQQAAFESVQKLFQQAQEARWLSTQEKAWLLRLADALGETKVLSGQQAISLDFQDMLLGEAVDYLVEQNNVSSFKNKSQQPMYLSFTATGINKKLSDSQGYNGMALQTHYYDLQTGLEIQLDEVPIGTEVLVRHKITLGNDRDVELSLEAPLPAGFELEIPRLSGERPEVSRLKHTAPTFQEFRDDRYLAAWSLKRGKRSLNKGDSTIAYVMRAITSGKFLVPAARIEDMYRPLYRANTAERYVTIHK
ncbi:MAG: alpha-2-macroglobulin family protein [Gammaproteobacteria bacterium]|nr:alpha-2-macroglobulin family protein [Gammaproteobacteria bacterium]